jgi:hypothetical protein
VALALAGIAACNGAISGLPAGPSSGQGGSGPGGGMGGATTLTVSCPKPEVGTPALRLLTRGEIVNTLNDIVPGIAAQWSSTLPASTVSAFGFDNDGSTTVGKQFASALLDTAQSLATVVTGSAASMFVPCASSSPDRTCAEQFLNQYGRRLFRRPLTAADHDRFLGFFDASLAKSNFTSALKWMLIGLIQSPNAVYRSEVGAVAGDHLRHLTAYEQATALAYTYGGSTPSEALLSKADAGDLGDVVALARDLQSTSAGQDVFRRFFQGYLGYTAVSSIQKPNVMNFSAVSADMIRETDAFIQDVVMNQHGGLKELLTATTTNPSAALATFYGFPAPASDYASITRPAGRGLGILAQGSFLATHASSDSSSPTKRGLFPLFRLFCQPKLEPPPNVPQIGQPVPGAKTTRQRYEEAHAAPGTSCAGCHRRFDPIGFGFEHYDEGGRFRDQDGGLPINSADGFPDPSDLTANRILFSFTGQEDLMTGMVQQPVINQCVAAYMATYAFGTGEACIGASQVSSLQDGSIGLAEAYVRLAAEPHFTTRNPTD